MATREAPPAKYPELGGFERDVTGTLRATSKAKRPQPEACLEQVERLVSSPVFLGSEALCKLLRYLAQHTLGSPSEHLKEYQIATEVFGRPADFDPQTDSFVRVQMGRLRSKLALYYDTDGAADAILVDLSKGRYILSFETRTTTQAPRALPDSELAEAAIIFPARPATIPVAEAARSHRIPWWTMLGWTTAGCLVVAGLLLRIFPGQINSVFPHSGSSSGKGMDPMPRVYRSFWGPFLEGPDQPFVIFANANFVGTAETGMRYFDPSRDAPQQISQHYTGVGEVLGVLELDRLFHNLGSEFRIKRGGLFTLDDARRNNLVFIGSPMENLTLKQIPSTHEFVFRRQLAGVGQWREVIIDLHAKAGENSVFPSEAEEAHEDTVYAVVALMRGLDPSRWTLILAGTSTIGTQAAVDYVSDKDSLAELLHQLNVSNPADLKPFEALVKVTVAKDVPLAARLVILRKTTQ